MIEEKQRAERNTTLRNAKPTQSTLTKPPCADTFDAHARGQTETVSKPRARPRRHCELANRVTYAHGFPGVRTTTHNHPTTARASGGRYDWSTGGAF